MKLQGTLTKDQKRNLNWEMKLEMRLDEICDLAGVPAVVTDSEGGVYSFNKEFSKTFKSSRSTPFISLKREFPDLIQKLRTKTSGDAEIRFAQKGEPNDSLRVSLQWISNDMALVRFFPDASDQRDIALTTNTQLLISQMPDNLVAACNEHFRITWTNEAFSFTTGFSPAEAAGKTLVEVLKGPETDSATIDQIITRISGCKPHRTELLAYSKEGKRYWLDLSLHPVFCNGEHTGFTALARDISPIKNAEQKFFNAFDLSPFLMMIVRDDDQLVVETNRQIEDMFGIRDTYQNKTLHDLLQFKSVDDEKTYFSEYKNTGTANLETELTSDGSAFKHVLVKGRRIYLEGVAHQLMTIKDISERKIAARALERSELRFRNLVDQLGTAIVQHNLNGEIALVNKTFCTILRKTESELAGKNIHDLCLPFINEDGSVLHGGIASIIMTAGSRESTAGRIIGIDYDDSIIWLLATSIPFTNADGDVEYFITSFTDVTERKRFEDETKRTKQLYESLVNTQSSFLVRTDMEGRYTYVNNAFCKTYEIPAEEFIGKSSLQTIIPEDQELCRETSILAINNPGKAFRVSLRKPHPRTEIMYSDWEFMCLLDKNGKPSEIQCVGLNVTDKREVIKKLSFSEAKLSSIVNNTPSMLVWSIDTDFRLLSANNTFSSYLKTVNGFEYEPGDKLFAVLNSAESQKTNISRWLDYYKRAFSGEAFQAEEWMGPRKYQFYLNPIHADGIIKGASILGNDITDRERKNEELLELNKKIGEMKLAALRTAMNPHFVFNALNSIQSFITTNDRTNAINYLSKFSRLMRGFLNSSIEPGISLSDELELLRYYIQIEQLRFDHKFDFTLVVEDHLDPGQIEIPPLLIQPFVENAILHGLNNKTERGLLKISVFSEGNDVIIAIEDDGVGRAKAAEIKKATFPSHHSLAMKITQERLELLRETRNIEIEIVDIREPDEKTGTKVLIKFNPQIN